MGRLAIAAAALWIPLSAGTTWAGEQQVRADPADLIALVRGNNVFAAEISDSLPTNKGSLFFSPYSLHTTLALASAGARQQTESQFLKTLNLSLPPERLHPAVADLRKRLLGDAKVNGCEFHVSNAIWGQKGYGLQKDFLLVAESHYGAALTEMDSESRTDPPGKAINTWCEKATRGEVKDLLRDENITGLTHMVLINTVCYYTGPADQGGQQAAHNRCLRRGTDGTVAILDAGRPGRRALWRLLELPRAGESPVPGTDQSVIIFMTKMAEEATSGTDEPASRRAPAPAGKRQAMEPGSFQIRSQFRLRTVLEAMKLTDAFSKAADFTGMNGWNDLHLCEVIHKAAVSVTPDGTEAVAATAVVINISARDPVFMAHSGQALLGCGRCAIPPVAPGRYVGKESSGR